MNVDEILAKAKQQLPFLAGLVDKVQAKVKKKKSSDEEDDDEEYEDEEDDDEYEDDDEGTELTNPDKTAEVDVTEITRTATEVTEIDDEDDETEETELMDDDDDEYEDDDEEEEEEEEEEEGGGEGLTEKELQRKALIKKLVWGGVLAFLVLEVLVESPEKKIAAHNAKVKAKLAKQKAKKGKGKKKQKQEQPNAVADNTQDPATQQPAIQDPVIADPVINEPVKAEPIRQEPVVTKTEPRPQPTPEPIPTVKKEPPKVVDNLPEKIPQVASNDSLDNVMKEMKESQDKKRKKLGESKDAGMGAMPVGMKDMKDGGLAMDLDKVAKKVKANQKLEKQGQPDYLSLGRGLVYNCEGGHWACVNRESYFQCQRNMKWTKQEKSNFECHTVAVYASIEDCEIVQIHNINIAKPAKFCK